MAKSKEIPSVSLESLGELKAARLAKNITQEEMAENLGCTRATYSRLENGHASILSDKWNRACDLLDMESYVCLVPKGSPQMEVAKMSELLLQQENEIGQLRARVKELEEKIAERDFTIKVLKENRELRIGKE